MSELDAHYDIDEVDEQIDAQLDTYLADQDGRGEELVLDATTVDETVPVQVVGAALPCVTDAQLDAFHDLMADPHYEHSKKLLTASQRADILGLLDFEGFKPAWYNPSDTKTRARLAKLRNHANNNYLVIDHQLYRRIASKREGDDLLLRQVFVYDAGDIIVARHKSLGHIGEDKTWQDISRKYYGISQMQVKMILKQCTTCMKQAPNRTRAPLQPILVERTLERLQIDMMDIGSIPAGPYKWILHIKDHFSKYSMLYPLTTKESAKIADCLQEFIRYYGVPEIIQSDNGREFKGAVVMLCKRLKIRIINGRPRHPQTQGLVEQANGVAKAKIRAWMVDNNSKYWPDAFIACG